VLVRHRIRRDAQRRAHPGQRLGGLGVVPEAHAKRERRALTALELVQIAVHTREHADCQPPGVRFERFGTELPEPGHGHAHASIAAAN
jgi:hypothetical protein